MLPSYTCHLLFICPQCAPCELYSVNLTVGRKGDARMAIYGGGKKASNVYWGYSALALLLWTLPGGAAGATAGAVVAPRIETPALLDDDAGGNANADDPAIWVHPRHPHASLVIGTKKDAGLSVYNLHGHEVQAIPAPPAPDPDAAPGRFNNVDVFYGFPLDGRTVDVAVTTDRGRDQLRFYAIEPDQDSPERQPLRDVTAAEVPWVFSNSPVEVNEQ